MFKKLTLLAVISATLLACSLTAAPSVVTPTPEGPTPTVAETIIPPSLRNYAENKGLQFGTYFPLTGFADPNWQVIAAEEFDLANIFDGFTWRELEPQQGVFDFSRVDPQVAFALDHDMQVCGHTLFWPSYQWVYPDWVLNGGFSKTQLSQYMRDYLTAVIDHYRGQITCWIVVEEPYNLPERDWDLFYSAFGDYSYITLAYQIVREADPDARLVYNDEYNHTPDGENTALTRQIVEQLKQQGLIDSVGLTMHLDAMDPPDKQQVIDTMVAYGIPVRVTEMQVSLAGVTGTQDERYALQARVFGDMLSACLESNVCQEFSLWGFGDQYNYLERYYADADPTPFDDTLTPKPAYYTMLDLLKP